MLGHEWDEERRQASARNSFVEKMDSNLRFHDSLDDDDRAAYEAAAMRCFITGKPVEVVLKAA